jgi:hypothetical protein
MRNSVMQMGYVTKNLDDGIDYWINVVGAGPFYIADFATTDQVYRGAPTNVHVTVAMGYSGDLQIELVQQNNDAPSVYTEILSSGRKIPRGGLFHHVMVKHDDYDTTYHDYLAAGASRSFDAVVPGVGRYCYLDARNMMDCFVELLEVSPPFDAACRQMREAHRNWDGQTPRRSYESLFT